MCHACFLGRDRRVATEAMNDDYAAALDLLFDQRIQLEVMGDLMRSGASLVDIQTRNPPAH